MMAQTPAEKWLRGPVGFTLISAMHLLMIYLITTALGKVQTIDLPQTKAVLIDDLAPPPDPLPVIRPKLIDDMAVDPVPEPTPVVEPADPPPDAVVIQSTPADLSGGAAEPAPVTLLAPRIDSRQPLSQPDYPPSEIRLAHEGRVLLRLRIGADGRVLAAEIVTSSGFPALDQAAVRTALREWRLVPARRGDAAVEGVFSTWVRFDLTDR